MNLKLYGIYVMIFLSIVFSLYYGNDLIYHIHELVIWIFTFLIIYLFTVWYFNKKTQDRLNKVLDRFDND